MIKIEYYNSYNILDVHYESGYKNWFWLKADVKKPKYVVSRDAYENSNGESITTFVRWEKQYSFEFFCLEPLADAMTTITMHDNVWITFENGYSARVKDFFVAVDWQSIDNIAKVNVTFVTKSFNVNGVMAAGCV